MTANPEHFPFKYGATAHFPPKKRGKSDLVIIEITQHPIVYSRAVATSRSDRKMAVNEDYLSVCWRICEKRCPIKRHTRLNVICQRMNASHAIAKTEDSSELDARKWSEVLGLGLCRPVLY